MIEEKLEILLITYNRSNDLENTFQQLSNSPFIDCKITVLDNCSTDDTPLICGEYQKLFPKMNIIRHKKNIGGNANQLRAVELSESLYTWIICDDDNYDFSDCSDVIEAVESGKYDIISVGHPSYSNWERGVETTTKKLIDNGATYFITLSFLPSSIYKTGLYDSSCIHKGYSIIYTLFPQMAFTNKSVEENFLIYVSKKEIINRGEDNKPGYSGLEWFSGWMNACFNIKDKKIRRKAVQELSFDSTLIVSILDLIKFEKISNNAESLKTYLSLISSFILTFEYSKEILLLLIIIPSVLIPAWFYKQIAKIYLILKYGKNEYKKRFDEISHADQDIFRT